MIPRLPHNLIGALTQVSDWALRREPKRVTAATGLLRTPMPDGRVIATSRLGSQQLSAGQRGQRYQCDLFEGEMGQMTVVASWSFSSMEQARDHHLSLEYRLAAQIYAAQQGLDEQELWDR